MQQPTALPEFALNVQQDWLDYNGHMNLAYYVLAFDYATDHAYEQWQIGEAYLDSGHSVFTLAINVDYLAELFAGDPIRIVTQLIGVDYKRIHYFHHMYHGSTDELVATNECLCINVSLDTRRSAPFAAPILQHLQTVQQAHRTQPLPQRLGRKLSL